MKATEKDTYFLQLTSDARELVFEDDLFALAAYDSDLPFGMRPGEEREPEEETKRWRVRSEKKKERKKET